jgi:hypothetical protein
MGESFRSLGDYGLGIASISYTSFDVGLCVEASDGEANRQELAGVDFFYAGSAKSWF